MNIGTAAERSKLPSKTIRYYEDIELIKPARADNGYRNYSENDIHRLTFLQRSRSLGFTIDQCRLLLSLYDDTNRASADVKSIALKKIAEIESKIDQLQTLKTTLTALADGCQGNHRPDCPIIDDLSGRSDH